MSQAVARNTNTTTGKALNVILWILQIGAAALFLLAAWTKLTSDPQSVQGFAMIGQKIGVGQWFRYLTGSLELLGAVLLLIPRLCGVGALILACVMLGAIPTHLFIIGGSPVAAIILLLVMIIIAWGRRERTLSLLGK
ncbi:MAG: DoxX family protein [Acidobacteria bacterium]|nr:DoxX family protein [Acidobacteriota bacterium]